MTHDDFTERLKRLQKDRDQAVTKTRRFLWADFLLVVVVIAVALYLLWPLLFTGNEPYAPISTVNQAFRFMHRLQMIVLEESQNKEELDFTEQWFQTINGKLKNEDQAEGPYWSIVTSDGTWRASEDEKDFWLSLPGKYFQSQPGIYSYSSEGRATLIFVDLLPDTNYKLLVASPYPLLFQQ